MLGLDKQSRLNRNLMKAIAAGKTNRARQLLDAGASVESRSGIMSWRMTALAYAAWYGHIEIVKLLIERGADVNARDTSGDTPLINALIKTQPVIAGILLDHGAEVDVTGGAGRKPVALAAGNPALLRRMLGEPEHAPQPEPVKPQLPPAESSEEVVLMRPFGNRLLEETFNFAARERITLLRNGMDGPVEAMTREGFDAIGDKAALRYAFELYKAKGGKRPESEVFPDALGKPAIFPGRQP